MPLSVEIPAHCALVTPHAVFTDQTVRFTFDGARSCVAVDWAVWKSFNPRRHINYSDLEIMVFGLRRYLREQRWKDPDFRVEEILSHIDPSLLDPEYEPRVDGDTLWITFLEWPFPVTFGGNSHCWVVTMRSAPELAVRTHKLTQSVATLLDRSIPTIVVRVDPWTQVVLEGELAIRALPLFKTDSYGFTDLHIIAELGLSELMQKLGRLPDPN